MRTIDATDDRMVAENVAETHEEVSKQTTDPSAGLAPPPEIIADRFEAPQDLPLVIADRSEAVGPHPEIVTDRSEAVGPHPENIADRSEAVGPHPEIVTDRSEAVGPHPEIVADRFEAVGPHPEIVTDRSEALEPLPRINADRSEAPEAHPEIITDPFQPPEQFPETVADRFEGPHPLRGMNTDSLRVPRGLSKVARPSQNESEHDFGQAYQSLLPKLLALRPSDLVPINVGIPNAVTKALNVQPALAELKDRIAAALPEVDVRLPEDLATHALALSHAHTQLVTALQGSDALPSLAAEGKKLRTLLLGEAQTLVRRGQIDAEVLRGLRTDKGYRNLAFDLQLLTQVFRRSPARTGLSSVSAAEIQHADELAKTILTLIARRKKLRASIEEAVELRKRAYTLFTRSYDEARRVVVYLRWREGDADELVPLLHANRNARSKKRSKNTTRDMQ